MAQEEAEKNRKAESALLVNRRKFEHVKKLIKSDRDVKRSERKRRFVNYFILTLNNSQIGGLILQRS